MEYIFRNLLMLFFIFASTINARGQQLERGNTTDSLLKKWPQTINGSYSELSAAVFDSAQIVRFHKTYPQLKKYAAQMQTFYRKRNYSFAWFQRGLLTEQATNFSKRALNFENEGVYKQAPYQKALDSLLRESTVTTGPKLPDVRLELMLTAQYFVFSKLAWEGMTVEISRSAGWYLPRKKVSYEQYLDSLLISPGQKSNAGEPVYRQYELLRGFLNRYLALDTRYNWFPIVMNSKSLKPGDNSFTIPLIKKRLYMLEDYKGDTVSYVFTGDLETGVKIFQARHGLVNDGIINKATLNEINVPVKNRIRQIVVNMERSRWLPVREAKNYIAVNIPEFKLHIYTDDSLLWSSNVVVGKSVRQTTVFYGDIKYVVFSPYWNVPESIVRNEVVPAMKRNANYLAAGNMEITGHHNGLPIVRQKPGPANSLGLVKFLFPNSYNIYLHDTPAKSLFEQSSRAFSHGCIRVGDPAKLAAFLLNDSTVWNAATIAGAMHAGAERYVTLTNTVPVFIAYLTAFTDRDNRLNFRKDIYSLDEQLASRIISGEGTY